MIIGRELQLTSLMIILTVFSILSTYIEHKKWHLINQASLAITIGVFIGILLYKSDTSENAFSQAFFYVLLPIIVFKEGYSLNKHHFFKNFFYIALYGIGGTLLNFVLIALLTTLMNNQGWITIQGLNNEERKKIPDPPLSTIAILFYSACISSKDSVLVLQLLDFKKRPKLYSILFGEQMLNDLVVFSLQKAVESLQKKSKNQGKEDIENELFNYLIFSGIFLEQILVSILVGSIIGMTFTLITKQFRFLVKHKAICTALTIYSGYLSFAVCETFGYSGVVSVLICGAYMSHYLTYNFSISSAHSSKTTINTLAYISEAFIYIFLGFSASGFIIPTQNQQYAWSYSLILSQYFVIIPLARLLSLILTHVVAIVTRLKTKKKWRINRYEFLVIFYSGLIRGPVAFALIQLFESNANSIGKPVITSTTVALVVLSTVLIAGSLNYVISWAFNRIELDDKYHEDHPSVTERLMSASSFHAEPAIQVDIELYKQFTSKSQKFFQSFDENYMKPFMIYDYKVRKNDIKAAKKENQFIEQMIQKQEYDLFDDDVKKRRILNIEMVNEQNSQEIDYQDCLSQYKSLNNCEENSTETIKKD